MMTGPTLLFLCASLGGLDNAGRAPADLLNELTQCNRVLFLGDSITYDGRYAAQFDAWLSLRFPDRSIEVLNLGLPSETVSGLSEPGHAKGEFPRPDLAERLDRVLAAVQPDFVIACYGMNCGIYMPFDETRFLRFQEGMTRLHDSVTALGVPIVHVTPPVFDATRNSSAPGYNDVLARYSAWLVSKRDDGWNVIDLHSAMTREVAKRRETETDFTFQPDGVHPEDAGHRFIAQQIIGYLDAHARDATGPEMLLSGASDATRLIALTHDRGKLLRDAWLTSTRHIRPGLPEGLSLEAARSKAAEFSKEIDALRER